MIGGSVMGGGGENSMGIRDGGEAIGD